MIANYTRTAWRSLLKNRIFSIINIMGLAAGIAAFLFITTYVWYEQSYESFIPKADNLWRITLDRYTGSEYVVTDCETHAPMAGILKSKYPEVLGSVRMFAADGLRTVQLGDKKFIETGLYFADPSVFDLLGVNASTGDPSKALNDPYQVAISEQQAIKMFGKTDVLGESMMIDGTTYHLTCVFKDRPQNTHLKFDFLMSHATLHKLRDWYTDEAWNGNNEYTYLLMQPGTDLAEFNQKLQETSENLKDKLYEDRYAAETMNSIHLHSNKTFEPEANGNAKVVSFLSIIAIFIIVIAWVNYMNLATARAVERAKEVGIRKVMGSLKSQLVVQFLTESFIVNLVAGFIALVIFQSAMPLFRGLTGLPSGVGLVNNIWLLFAGLVSIGALLAGIYPAFVLSSFKPVLVLKGKFKSSSHGQLLRKSLVVLQFGTTILLIVGVSAVYLQVKHLRSVDIGADLDRTIAVSAPFLDVPDSVYRSRFVAFKTEVTRSVDVVSASVCASFPGIPITEMSTTTINQKGGDGSGGDYEYYWYGVDEDFISTMGMSLAAGRNFQSGEIATLLINEEAALRLGFAKPEDAIGTETTFIAEWQGTQKNSRIVGVLKNFYQRSPKEEHLPMVFPYEPAGRYFTFRFKGDDVRSSMGSVKDSWEKVFPGEVFNFTFIDEKFDQQYRSDVQFGQVMGTFSLLAVIIACLGLFGLSSYTIVQRRKEIGIRKVLGASVSQVVGLLSGSYVRIILIASVIATPIAWFAVDNWLSGYTTRISLNAWMFVIPVIVIMSTALITVGIQTIKSAMTNPAESIQQE